MPQHQALREVLKPSIAATLVSETNHRVANNLAIVSALLSMQKQRLMQRGGGVNSEEIAAVLGEAQAQVHAASDLHRLLSACDNDDLDLGSFVIKVAAGTLAAMTRPGQVALITHSVEVCTISPDVAFSTALIVSELVVNAVKYAHPAGIKGGEIEIGCKTLRDGRTVVWVADDGVGLPVEFNRVEDGGLGMKTMRMLANEIGATFALHDGELGLHAELILRA